MQGLGELGWTDARNVRVEISWAADNLDRLGTFAKELVELQPDVLYTSATPATAALQRATRTIPIVFASVSDPIGAGFVASLPRPGGNITGFINLEGTLGGKWLELLTQIAPGIKRAAILSTRTRRRATDQIICAHSRRLPDRSKWSRLLCAFIATPKSKCP
jgi:putative tryptophan/tyrosine transport system substrate-binding protein